MKTTRILILTLAVAALAHADFSYTQTTKTSQAMGGMGGGAPQVTKFYFKGSKMASEMGDTVHIMDFSNGTMTSIDKAAKTYTVQKISDMMPAGAPPITPQIDMKETGQKKMVNGFNCTQVMMNMSMEVAMGARGSMKMNLDSEMWVSPDVPGWQSMRDFYQKNGNAFAQMGGGNPSMQAAMQQIEKKMIQVNGFPVQRIMRMRPGGGGAPGMPAMNDAQNAQMAQARARLQAMIDQGGPQADAARQALARLPGGGGGAPGGAPLFETTMDSSGFSSASIPDAVFAIPAGFTQK